MDKIFVNDEIYGYNVLVIDEQGNNKGEMLRRLAISNAREKGLDLIQISKNEKGMAVCKFGDASKIKFEASKKKKLAQKPIETKEMTFHLTTGDNDIKTKKNKVKAMLEKKCMVKFGVEIKGRERAFLETAKKMLAESVADLSSVAKWDDFRVDNGARASLVYVILKPIKECSHGDQQK